MYKRLVNQLRERKQSYPEVAYDSAFDEAVMSRLQPSLGRMDFLLPVVSLAVAYFVFFGSVSSDEFVFPESESEMMAFLVEYE